MHGAALVSKIPCQDRTLGQSGRSFYPCGAPSFALDSLLHATSAPEPSEGACLLRNTRAPPRTSFGGSPESNRSPCRGCPDSLDARIPRRISHPRSTRRTGRHHAAGRFGCSRRLLCGRLGSPFRLSIAVDYRRCSVTPLSRVPKGQHIGPAHGPKSPPQGTPRLARRKSTG